MKKKKKKSCTHCSETHRWIYPWIL